MKQITSLQCACGQVRLELQGAPITATECHCNSCRTAGARMQSLPSARAALSPNGGTPFVLYRKDRVRLLDGTDLLKAFRLTAQSSTRRVIAACCNTPVFLDFQSGHWLSLYGCLWPAGTLPRLEERTMTSDLPANTALPDDIPNSKRQSLSFFGKLLGAWIAMGFRRPKVAVGIGTIQV